MNNSYEDIRTRIPETPSWFDQNGVPRYGPFAPRCSPNIYADQVCLLEIACQSCAARFKVELSTYELSARTLEQGIRDRNLQYGDPPNHGCTGDAMESASIRVLEFWRLSAPGGVFERIGALEVDLRNDRYSPKRTIDSVIDGNIFEESPVALTLMELRQNFPDEPVEALRRRTKERLEAKARAGEIGFYRRTLPSIEMRDITAEEAIAQLSQQDTWDYEKDDELIAYKAEDPAKVP